MTLSMGRPRGVEGGGTESLESDTYKAEPVSTTCGGLKHGCGDVGATLDMLSPPLCSHSIPSADAARTARPLGLKRIPAIQSLWSGLVTRRTNREKLLPTRTWARPE